MAWNYGESTVTSINKRRLRDRGFPDADVCCLPLEHKPRGVVHKVEKDERTYLVASRTEWVAGKTWGEL